MCVGGGGGGFMVHCVRSGMCIENCVPMSSSLILVLTETVPVL